MRDLIVSEDIVPIGEFKKHASRLLRRVREEGRPIVVTQNGKPAGVVVPSEEYDRLTEQARLVAAVRAGLADAEAGRTADEPTARARLEERFGPLDA